MNLIANNNNDLTTGSLSKGLLRLTWPMLVSITLQNIQSLIDLFWVGGLGTSSVAALAMSGTVLMLIFPVILGMDAGTVAYVSRHVGSGNHKVASAAAGQSLILALLSGIVAGIIGFIFTKKLLIILGAEPEVLKLGTAYLKISFMGSFTIFVLFIGNSIMRSAGNTIIPMFAMVLANILNLILDPIMIFGLFRFPEMGVQGAALATITSQAIAATIVVLFISKGTTGIHVHLKQLKIIPRLAWKILRIGIPSLGQMFSRSLMALVLMHIVAKFGTAAIAAYGIGIRFLMIILMPSFAFANSASAMVGQNLGAKRPDRAQRAAWLATITDLSILAVLTSIIAIFAPKLISFFDNNPEVIRTGTSFLRTASPFYMFAGLGIVLGRSLNGAGSTIPTMVLTVVCLWGLQVPLAIMLPKVTDPPILGIWRAFAIAITVHGLSVMVWFQTGRWKKIKVD